MPKTILTVLSGLALLLARSAAAETVTLDPAKSQVRFTLGATMHTVHGTLRLERGVFHLDRAGTASGEIVLDAKSANTGSAGRDKDMHEKVLETAKYPRITFTVERVEGKVPASGSAEVKLHGSLDFHGGRHALIVPAQVTVGNGQVTGTATLQIPYVAWGLKDPSTFVLRVDKEVKVEVKVVGRLAA
jgi:polyisoprenoid-binding protein YceI